MISVWKQFLLLVWKAYVIKRKQKILVCGEIFIPIFLFFLLFLVRTRDFNMKNSACHYDSKALTSAGFLPFMHGFFCSFANDCNESPTTGDEQQIINNSTRESIAVSTIREWLDFFKQVGKNMETGRIVFSTLVEMTQSVIRVDENKDELKRYPFHLLFHSKASMKNFLKNGLNYSSTDVDLFNHLYLTPLFPLCVYDIAMQSRDFPVILFDKPIDSFCNPAKLHTCFIGDGFNVSVLNLCKFKYADIALMMFRYEDDFDINHMSNRFFEHVVPDQMKNIAPSVNESLTVNSLANIFNSFSDFNFMDKFNNTSIMDALFCGKFPNLTYNEDNEFGNTLDPNSIIVKIQRQLVDFIQKNLPSQKSNEKNVCGNITVGQCSNNYFNFMHAKSLFQGYILVTPDTPLVRSIIDDLNKPLRYANLVHDLIVDMDRVSIDMQNEMGRSSLTAFMSTFAKRLYKFGLINEQTKTSLKHLFNNSSDPDALFPRIKDALKFVCFRFDRFIFVESEYEMENIALCLSDYGEYFTGLVFPNLTQNDTELPPITTYKIRHNPKLVDSTSYIAQSSNTFSHENSLLDSKYLTFGFAFLQDALERTIVERQTNTTLRIGLYAQQEAYPNTLFDFFDISIYLSFFVMISFMTPAALLVKNIVFEKERRLKEMMRIMSLGDIIHWIAWAFQTLLFNLISILIISVLLCYGRVLPNTDVTLVMSILFLFSLACAAQCVFLSVFFSRANLATACTALLYFLMYVPFQLSGRSNNRVFTMFTLLLPQSGIGYCCTMIARAEKQKIGTWENLHMILLTDYKVSLSEIFIAFVFDFILYSILAWYISAVFPGKYGVSLPFHFCFTRSYWIGSKIERMEKPRVFFENGENFEPITQKMAVEIRDLVKVYENNTRALDSLNVSFYENQITGLLGHNGAGKSTTISILCGLYPPTKGTAFIYGMDIRTDMSRIRDYLGVCPQHNILFDYMTVEEQLQFYACLKGVPEYRLKSEVDSFLVDIGLADKRYLLSHELSGGMKRKLSIAIALIGGSKLVILDEPTAGVDPRARRSIWSLLIKHKEGRTIILSTHHMDEADILSDRITIISEGQLKTAGSSMFLKKKFGVGFKLTIVKQRFIATQERSNHSVETVATRMRRFLDLNNLREVKMIEDLGVEIQYLMPLNLSEITLASFFENLETEKANIGIESFGFTVPTLQKIFLKVASHKELILKKRPDIFSRLKNYLKHDQVEINSKAVIDDEIPDDIPRPSMRFVDNSQTLLAQKCRALFIKRIHVSKRNLFPMFCELILPIFMLLIAELYSKFQNNNRDTKFMVTQMPLNISQSLYGNNTQFYYGLWDNSSTKVLSALVSEPGPGLRCVNGLNIRTSNYFPMKCIPEASNGKFDLHKEWKISEYTNKTIYNVNQTCGKLESGEWNCTYKDYPVNELQQVRFKTTDSIFSLTRRNISQFRMITFQNTTSWNYRIIGGWTFGHTNKNGLNQSDLVLINQGLQYVWDIFNSTSKLLKFDWQSVLNNATLLTNNDPFLPNDSTIINSFKAIFKNMEVEDAVKIWFNNKTRLSLPIAINLFYNAALRSNLLPGKSPSNFGILAISHPMKETAKDGLDSIPIQKRVSFRIVLIIFAICVISSSFSMFLVSENASKSKHLQQVFGISPFLYHLVNLIYDFIIYFICVLFMILTYWLVETPFFMFTFEAFVSSIILFAFHGLCILPFIYICQLFFTVPSMAFAIISIGLFLFGSMSTSVVMFLESLKTGDDLIIIANKICSTIFMIIPPYNLGMAINRLNFIYNMRIFAGNFLENIGRSDLKDKIPLPMLSEWDLMGKHIVSLFVSAIFYSTLLMIIEYRRVLFNFLRIFERRSTRRLLAKVDSSNLDKDVQEEQEILQKLDDFKDYGLVVKNLSKSYNNENLAVKGISFAVANGEVFGLLGVNGSGKTTIFSMLTGSLTIGCGDVIVSGSSMVKDNFLSLRQVGYCPQFDALNLKLTAKEQLIFYARIRGVCETDIDEIVDWSIKHMKLKPYANEISEFYSGGNKRKLSAAIALISDPSVVLLDEPSAGMDPSSQQFMWNLIFQIRRSNRAVVITSHSMEECEELCSRTAIMVEGQFKCLGSIQHLKERFGEGYSITIKLASVDEVEQLKQTIEMILPEAKFVYSNLLSFFYRINGGSNVLPVLFRGIAKLKKNIAIEDFSISQTSLDDVFVSFALASEENGSVEEFNLA